LALKEDSVARAQAPIEQVVRQHAAEHPQSTWL
jgi:hypothetical protein